MTHKLILAGSLLMLAGGCATRENVATTSHEEEVCQMPEIEGKSAGAQSSKTYTTFGGDQKLTDADAIPVAKVLAEPAQYDGKHVRVTGVVSSVCPKKGCWMRVTSKGASAGDSNIFIKFADPPEGRLIPLEAVGHTVVVEGTIKNGTMSEAAARHFKQDAGASEAEIKKIVGPQPQVTIAQPAVAIEGVAKSN